VAFQGSVSDVMLWKSGEQITQSAVNFSLVPCFGIGQTHGFPQEIYVLPSFTTSFSTSVLAHCHEHSLSNETSTGVICKQNGCHEGNAF